MKKAGNTGLTRVLHVLGISSNALLGQGGESWVFALDDARIARINHPAASRAQVDDRSALLAELGRSAANVPFSIPVILDTVAVDRYNITIERRLPGRPLSEVLAELAGEARTSLIRAYLEAASQIGDLVLNRPYYGDLLPGNAIHTPTFRAYLEKRAAQSLRAAGPDFKTVNPAQLAAALPEPAEAAVVHLDAFPGNMLVEDGIITAVIDFGTSSIMGDRRLDPLTAAVYLAPLITPTATANDRAVAQEWLATSGLAGHYLAVQDWIAAYWSFAQDDINTHRWCRKILVG